MYEAFYGLQERPFELTPNPRYLLLTERHKEALTILQYGIRTRKSITMVLGQAGTGKTTLVRASIGNLARGNIRCVHLNNPTLTRDELIEWLAGEFELGAAAARSKAALLARLEALLIERRKAGIISALIVDEAQALPDGLLGELRLLLNLESDAEKLLTVVLVGQAELADRLNLPEHAAVKQRVALRCELLPLSLAETAQYVAARIRVAGGVPANIFSREAVDLIHERSHGIPRTISVICDNALVSGFAVGQRPIGRRLVLEVCDDFDLKAAEEAPTPPPPVEAPRVDPLPPHDPLPAAPHVREDVAPAAAVAGRPAELFGMFKRDERSWFSR